MELQSILLDLKICNDVIKLILQYNATFLGFVELKDGSISVQDYYSKKELNLLKFDDPTSYSFHDRSLLILPEFNWVMQSFAGNRVHIWDFHTGHLIWRCCFRKFVPNNSIRFAFWVPQLKKALLIVDNRIHTFTMVKETQQAEVKTVIAFIDQENIHLNHAGPEPTNPFEFRIKYVDGQPYQQNVIFNIDTQKLTHHIESKEYGHLRIEKIWPWSKTSSLVFVYCTNSYRRSCWFFEDGFFQSPILIHGLNGFDGTLEACVHVHGSEYRLHYFQYRVGKDELYCDFQAILQFEEGKYSFRIISGALRRDPTQAVLLTEHHYSQPKSYFDSCNSILMYPISFVMLFFCLWYFFL